MVISKMETVVNRGFRGAAEPQDVYWTNDLEALIYYIDRLGGKIDSRYENVEGRIVVKY